MATRPIVVYPHPTLLAPTREVTAVDDDLRRLVQDMIETMHAEPGVGLAANQVADDRRVTVIDLTAGEEPGQVKVLINPRIVEQSGRQSGEEGCLSFPGIFEVIERPERVRITALDLDMNPIEEEAEGFYARAICHELDHLDGTVFLQRMSPLKRRLVLRRIEKLKRQGEWPAEVMAG
jgi:peptide deformylase